MKNREKLARRCNDALIEKYAIHPEVRRIARHRQVPKHIYNARAELRTLREKSKRKYVHTTIYIVVYIFINNFGTNISIKYCSSQLNIVKSYREANRRSHSKKDTVPFVSEREKHVVRQDN